MLIWVSAFILKCLDLNTSTSRCFSAESKSRHPRLTGPTSKRPKVVPISLADPMGERLFEMIIIMAVVEATVLTTPMLDLILTLHKWTPASLLRRHLGISTEGHPRLQREDGLNLRQDHHLLTETLLMGTHSPQEILPTPRLRRLRLHIIIKIAITMEITETKTLAITTKGQFQMVVTAVKTKEMGCSRTIWGERETQALYRVAIFHQILFCK